MKKIILPLIMIAIAVVTSSCSDQQQIFKNLTSQSGRWNIDNFKTTITTTGESPNVAEFGDSGFMYFFENNDGQIIYTYDEEVVFIEFEWEITDEGKLYINYDNEEFEYDIVTNEKDRQVIVYEESVPITDLITTTTTIEYELLRIE